MTAVVAQVHLPDLNGVPADDTVNTFVFVDTNSISTAFGLATAIQALLPGFYVGGSGPRAVGSWLATNLDRGVGKCFIDYYQLAAPGSVTPQLPLGGPVLRGTFTLPAADSGGDLPREVASVLSIQSAHAGLAESVPGGPSGPAGDTHPAARHRGRIYLGPFIGEISGSGVNGPGVAPDFRAATMTAAAALGTQVAASEGGTRYWGIWSRANHAITQVVSGWMDDAFDTQRRRGIKATQRSTFNVPG